MQKKKFIDTNATPPTSTKKLLVRCSVRLGQETSQVEIHRGDRVTAKDGEEVGVVAAVLLDCYRQEATHFLLEIVPPTAVYYLIPLSLIDKFDEESIWLGITIEAVKNQPKYQPDC